MTKPQKIEGGWVASDEFLGNVFRWFYSNDIRIRSDRFQDLLGVFEKELSTEIEKAKSEALKQANDLLTSDAYKEKYAEILEEVRASERQRCVENLKGVGLMLEEYKCGEHKKVHKVIKQLIDQAKHSLEQMK